MTDCTGGDSSFDGKAVNRIALALHLQNSLRMSFAQPLER